MTEPENQRLARAKCYHTMDAFVKLVAVLMRFTGEPTNIQPKVNVLQKVIYTVAQVSSIFSYSVVFHSIFRFCCKTIRPEDRISISYPIRGSSSCC